MPRQTNKRADAILSADIHLRDRVPECRQPEEFWAARDRKMAFLRDLQAEHGCPILDAGDVFDRWQVSSELEGWALLNLPAGIITVPGNHDLPQHNLSLYRKSSLHVLEAAGRVRVLRGDADGKGDWETIAGGVKVVGFPYGEPFREITAEGKQIAVVHTYCAEAVPVFIEGYTPAQLLTALPGYDFIVSGHNHAAFTREVVGRRGDKRLVVNPGGMMRTTADQADARPRVYLWYADTNTVDAVFYPIEAGVVSRTHLERVEERDARMTAFVSRLGSDMDISLSFEDNVEKFLAANKIRPEVGKLVREAMNVN
jgi:predicted phosphodiesterase